MGEQLEALAAEPALRLVDEPVRLTRLAGDAGERESRPLPDLVVVDLGDRAAMRFCSCAFTERRCIRFSFSEWLSGKKSSNE